MKYKFEEINAQKLSDFCKIYIIDDNLKKSLTILVSLLTKSDMEIYEIIGLYKGNIQIIYYYLFDTEVEAKFDSIIINTNLSLRVNTYIENIKTHYNRLINII